MRNHKKYVYLYKKITLVQCRLENEKLESFKREKKYWKCNAYTRIRGEKIEKGAHKLKRIFCVQEVTQVPPLCFPYSHIEKEVLICLDEKCVFLSKEKACSSVATRSYKCSTYIHGDSNFEVNFPNKSENAAEHETENLRDTEGVFVYFHFGKI